MNNDLKPCINCVHHKEYGDYDFKFHYCHHPEFTKEKTDYVNGETWEVYSFCHLVRENQNLCGSKGEGWLLKETEDPPEREHSTLRHLLNLFGLLTSKTNE